MGSIVRYSTLEAFEEKFGHKIRNYYKPLIGLKVEEIGEIETDYHVAAEVRLSDGRLLDTHFRWATEEEADTGEEIRETPEQLLYSEYFEQFIKGRVITKIETGYERDDEFYAYIIVEGDGSLEVPMYFYPEDLELGGCTILTKEEFEEFRQERLNR